MLILTLKIPLRILDLLIFDNYNSQYDQVYHVFVKQAKVMSYYVAAIVTTHVLNASVIHNLLGQLYDCYSTIYWIKQYIR